MDSREFRSALGQLGLSQLEAARLLGVKSRTIQRWVAGNPSVAEPAAQALRAWCRLAECGLAWRPDGTSLDAEELSATARRRQQAMGLDLMAKRIASRGGPSRRWRVNLKRRRAMAGPICVMFNAMANGGFCPASYRRQDGPAVRTRDSDLIEEAVTAFAVAVALAGPDWASQGVEPQRRRQQTPRPVASDGIGAP